MTARRHQWTALSTGEVDQAMIRAGYATTYGGSNVVDFQYITINGAGHMVPQYQPVAALQMIQQWVAGTPF